MPEHRDAARGGIDSSSMDTGRRSKATLFISSMVNGITPFVLYLMLAVPGDSWSKPVVAAVGGFVITSVTYLFVQRFGREKLAYAAGFGCMFVWLFGWSAWRSPDKYYWGLPVLTVIAVLRLSRLFGATSISSENRRALKMDCVVLCGCLPVMWLVENGQVAFPHTVIFLAVVGLVLRLYTVWRAERAESSTYGKGFGAASTILVVLAIAFGMYGTRLVVFGFIAVVYVLMFLLSPFLFLLPSNYHFVFHKKHTDVDPTQGATPGEMVASSQSLSHVIVMVIVSFTVITVGYFVFQLVRRGRRNTQIPSTAIIMALLAFTYLLMLPLSPVVNRLRAGAQEAIDRYEKGGPGAAPATDPLSTQSSASGQAVLHAVYNRGLIVLAVILVVGLSAYWIRMRKQTYPDDVETNESSRVRRSWLRSERSGLPFMKTTDPVRLRYQEWLESWQKTGQTMKRYETARQFEQRLRDLGAFREDSTLLRQAYEPVRYKTIDKDREGEQI